LRHRKYLTGIYNQLLGFVYIVKCFCKRTHGIIVHEIEITRIPTVKSEFRDGIDELLVSHLIAIIHVIKTIFNIWVLQYYYGSAFGFKRISLF